MSILIYNNNINFSFLNNVEGLIFKNIFIIFSTIFLIICIFSLFIEIFLKNKKRKFLSFYFKNKNIFYLSYACIQFSIIFISFIVDPYLIHLIFNSTISYLTIYTLRLSTFIFSLFLNLIILAILLKFILNMKKNFIIHRICKK